MKMCFHGNQHPSSIKHPFISLYLKYQFLSFICLPVMNSPIFPSLDDIYCTLFEHDHLVRNMTWLLDRLSKNSGCQYVRVTHDGAYWSRDGNTHFVNHGICIYEEIILQFFAFWPKIVCWIPENLREKISALIFSSITLSLQGIEAPIQFLNEMSL